MSPEMKWREGSRFKGDAQAVGEAIAEIASLHGGVCPPEVFLHEAMDESHPAHDDFEWDDDKAAYAYRLEQARRIIKGRHGEGWLGPACPGGEQRGLALAGSAWSRQSPERQGRARQAWQVGGWSGLARQAR